MLLLCAYIVLGVTTRLTRRQAGGAAVAVTIVVIAVAMHGYLTSTPQDKYIPFVDSGVYATGRPAPVSPENLSTSEDVTGANAATWFSTDHSPITAGSGGGG
jgi:hypothetical protein